MCIRDRWILLNSTLGRFDEFETELQDLHKITQQNSKSLYNLSTNSNINVLPNNTTRGMMADVDALVLEMQHDIEKLKLLV